MAVQHQAKARPRLPQRLQNREVAFAGYAKPCLDAMFQERRNQRFSAVHLR